MSRFALVLNGEIVDIASATFAVSAEMAWSGDVSSVTPPPQVGWAAAEAAGLWTFTAPEGPTPDIAASARAALTASDRTMARTVEAVIRGATTFSAPDVVAYAAYRDSLRAILQPGSTVTSLPVAPPFPVGT